MGWEVEAKWEADGMFCVVVMTSMGHRCGYVGVGKDHPLYGAAYDEKHPALERAWEARKKQTDDLQKIGLGPLLGVLSGTAAATPEMVFDVHGGITYSGGGDRYPVDGDWWFFGYDCAHAGDRGGGSLRGHTWTLEECRKECESLAAQLRAVADPEYSEALHELNEEFPGIEEKT